MKALLLHVVVVTSLVATPSYSINTTECPYTNSWAVEVRGGPKEAEALARKHGFVNKGQIGNLDNYFHFILKEGTEISLPQALQNENNVGYVEKQKLKRFVKKDYIIPSDPKWTKQWSLKNSGQTQGPSKLDLNVEPVWLQGITGYGTVVAFIDDGLEKSHPDLKDNFDSGASYDFIGDDDDPTPNYSAPEPERHGTSCAGEVGMAKNSHCGIGVAYESNIAGLRVNLKCVLEVTVAHALNHKYDHIDVYSNSWGPADLGYQVDGPGETEQLAFINGVTNGRNGKGSIYVWASGNGGDYYDSCAADGYASSIYTIAIGSADQSGGQAFYDENCASKMAVTFSFNSDTWTSHPYKQTSTTTIHGECVEDFTGTSASAPLVSGTIALALQANPALTWRDVQYLIAYTSNPDILSGGTWTTNGAGLRVSHQFGFGAIDAEAMVTRAQHWINVPEQQSDTVIPTTNSGQLNSLSSTLRVTIPSSGNIRFLEHVVVTMTLSFDITEEEYDDVTQYLSDYYIDGGSFDQLSLSGRGDIQIELSSPSGTSSVIYPYRVLDVVPGDLIEWPFMSVHYWGEDPEGDWVLTVQYTGSDYTVSMSNLRVTFYGTTAIPQAVSQIPDTCDSVCARGCAKTGSEFCDACGSEYLRNATTLECVAECSAEYAVRSKYCYDPNAPEPVCNRTIVASPGGGTGSAPPSVAASFLLLALCAITGALSLLF